MRLLLAGTVRSGDTLLDTGLRDLEIHVQDGAVRLYASTGAGGGVTGWALGDGAAPSEINRQYFPDWAQDNITGLAGIDTDASGTRLMLGSTGGGQILSYALDASGQVSGLTQDSVPAGTGRVPELLSHGDTMYYADVDAGTLKATHDGNAVNGLTGSDFALSGDAQLAVASPGSTAMLLMADPGRQGVISYEINPANGRLTRLDSMGLDEGLGIGIPSALETATAHGQTWVLMAGAQSGAISVLRLDAAGGFTATDHIIDNLETRFGGAQALAVTEAQGRVFVVAGGGDDGLSLFELSPDGQLIHLQSLAHDTGLGLMDVREIAATAVGDEIQIFVASDDASGMAQFTVALDDLGDTLHNSGNSARSLTGGGDDDMLVAGTAQDTLSGGGGDDILIGTEGGGTMWGGDGADIFMPGYGAGTTRIHDFNPDQDQLDLSDFPMLRGPDQLSVTQTSDGVRVTWRDAVIEITSNDGDPITADDLWGRAFDWPDRVLLLGAQGGVSISARPGGEYLTGSARADTITGGSGSDEVWAQDGGDVISGGAGRDSLGGQGGDDTILGDGGDDMLAGGSGADSLRGGDGGDAIWAGAGNDTGGGDAGNDTLGGGTGADSLDGGDGNDELWGGTGGDVLLGSGGHDTLGGYHGDDTLRGGAGSDELWGSDGADQLFGGSSGDTIGGGNHADQVEGDGGDDMLFGGSGQDTVSGGSGDDRLYGARDADTLMGGNGDDSLWGGAGDDWLEGGVGADVFHFSLDAGDAVIADFEVATDHIHVYDPDLSFAQLQITQDGADLEIALGSGSVRLTDTQVSDLSEDDFTFGW